MRILLVTLLLVLQVFATACATKKAIPVGEVPVAEQPSPDVIDSTQMMLTSNFQKEGVTLRQTGEDYERIQKILLRIEGAAGITDFNFPLYVAVSKDDVNAMAVSGNTIVFYEELIKRVPEDDQLATIMAHEVAHILARHDKDDSAESRQRALSIGSSILGTAAAIGTSLAGVGSLGAGLAGDATQVATQVVGMGAFVRSYDRRLEGEADHVGLMLMARAGYDPNAALVFWSRADEVFGSNSSFDFLSTHPSSGNREKRLMEAMPKALEYYEQRKQNENLWAANILHQKPSKEMTTLGKIQKKKPLPKKIANASEEELYSSIAQSYRKKGLAKRQTDEIVQTLRKSMGQMPPEYRLQSLRQTWQMLQ